MTKNSILLTAVFAMLGLVAIGTNAYAGAEVIHNNITQDISGDTIGTNSCDTSVGEIIFDEGAFVKVNEQIVVLPNGKVLTSINIHVHGPATDTDGNQYIIMNSINIKVHVDLDGTLVLTMINVKFISLSNEVDSLLVTVVIAIDSEGGPPQVIITRDDCV